MRRYIVLTLGTLAIAGCPAGFTDLCDNGACDTDSSTGDSGVDAPPGCDLTKDPKDSLACVDDSVGIFVDATNGKDTNAGTKLAPMQTIGAALGKTNTQHARLYICEGTYGEDLTLDTSHDGMSLYGGWKCADWSYSGTKPVVGKTNQASKLDSLVKGTTIEDLTIQSADATNPGDSSIAMFVNASSGIKVIRVNLTAGSGSNGGSGTTLGYAFPAQSALNGNNASGNIPGMLQTTTCPAGDTTTGGAGGASGFSGDSGTPSYLDGGAGGVLGQPCSGAGGGGGGALGPNGTDGPSPLNVGTLNASGWLPVSGTAGQAGKCGQGGGGGQGSGNMAGGGGGGGGCGGIGGGAGGAGGASVALAALGSAVNIQQSVLTATTAGNGGNGSAGQGGESFSGFGGSPGNGAFPGCQGGPGGVGGTGGAGSGGVGGVSAGVIWKGSPPSIDSATQTAISVAASGGKKGTGGNSTVHDGLDGVAMTVYQSP